MAIRKKPVKKLKQSALRTLASNLATAKIAAAKKQTQRMPWHPPVLNGPPTVQTFQMTARLIAADGRQEFLAHVPARLLAIPEVPNVVMLERRVFLLKNTLPLTYTEALFAEATRI